MENMTPAAARSDPTNRCHPIDKATLKWSKPLSDRYEMARSVKSEAKDRLHAARSARWPWTLRNVSCWPGKLASGRGSAIGRIQILQDVMNAPVEFRLVKEIPVGLGRDGEPVRHPDPGCGQLPVHLAEGGVLASHPGNILDTDLLEPEDLGSGSDTVRHDPTPLQRWVFKPGQHRERRKNQRPMEQGGCQRAMGRSGQQQPLYSTRKRVGTALGR